MGYSTSDSLVRVDFFNPAGKWYDDAAIDMAGEYTNISLRDAIVKSILRHPHFGKRLREYAPYWTVVCLEPHHQHSHPQLLTFERNC